MRIHAPLVARGAVVSAARLCPCCRMATKDMTDQGIAKLTDGETCERSPEATTRCHAEWWTQVSCRQIRNAFDRARR